MLEISFKVARKHDNNRKKALIIRNACEIWNNMVRYINIVKMLKESRRELIEVASTGIFRAINLHQGKAFI